MDRLPVELLCMIFDQLPLPDVKNASLTCRRWESIIFSKYYIKRFALDVNIAQLVDANLTQQRLESQLEHSSRPYTNLIVSFNHIGDTLMDSLRLLSEIVTKLPQLQALHIRDKCSRFLIRRTMRMLFCIQKIQTQRFAPGDSPLVDAIHNIFEGFSDLTEMHIENYIITKSSLLHLLSKHSRLRRLTLYSSIIEDWHSDVIVHLPKLRWLRLGSFLSSPGINELYLNIFSMCRMPQLTVLELNFGDALFDYSIHSWALKTMPILFDGLHLFEPVSKIVIENGIFDREKWTLQQPLKTGLKKVCFRSCILSQQKYSWLRATFEKLPIQVEFRDCKSFANDPAHCSNIL